MKGRKLARALKKMNLSQKQLADILETNSETVNRWIKAGVTPRRWFQKQIKQLYQDFRSNKKKNKKE